MPTSRPFRYLDTQRVRTLLLTVSVLVCASFVLGAAVKDITTVVLLRRHGAPSQAYVITRSDAYHSWEQRFSYAFVAAGRKYRGYGYWSRGLGATVAITYLPSDPTVNTPGVAGEQMPSLVSCLGLISSIALFAVAIQIGRRSLQ